MEMVDFLLIEMSEKEVRGGGGGRRKEDRSSVGQTESWRAKDKRGEGDIAVCMGREGVEGVVVVGDKKQMG